MLDNAVQKFDPTMVCGIWLDEHASATIDAILLGAPAHPAFVNSGSGMGEALCASEPHSTCKLPSEIVKTKCFRVTENIEDSSGFARILAKRGAMVPSVHATAKPVAAAGEQ